MTGKRQKKQAVRDARNARYLDDVLTGRQPVQTIAKAHGVPRGTAYMLLQRHYDANPDDPRRAMSMRPEIAAMNMQRRKGRGPNEKAKGGPAAQAASKRAPAAVETVAETTVVDASARQPYPGAVTDDPKAPWGYTKAGVPRKRPGVPKGTNSRIQNQHARAAMVAQGVPPEPVASEQAAHLPNGQHFPLPPSGQLALLSDPTSPIAQLLNPEPSFGQQSIEHLTQLLRQALRERDALRVTLDIVLNERGSGS